MAGNVSLSWLRRVQNDRTLESLHLAQVGQDQQSLLAHVQLAPGRADPPSVAADDPSGVIQGLAGQRQRSQGWKSIWSPWRRMRILVDRFIYQGLHFAQGDTPYLIRTYGPEGPRSG
jgi:hypothetical protein